MTSSLTARIRQVESLSDAEVAQWKSWQAADAEQGSPFFRVEFAQIVSPHCPRSALAVFERDGETVGYFPFQRRGATVQPLAAPMNDYHGVIGPRDKRPSLNEVARLLAGECMGVSSWIGQTEGLILNPSYRAVVKPGQTYDDWYAERRQAFPKYFKDKERARRTLESNFGTIEVDCFSRDQAVLTELLALKSAQYRRSGLHDIFACGWTVEVLQALLASPHEDFGAYLCLLRAGGKVRAIEYALAGGQWYHFWFPAYYPEASRASPGITLSMETIRLRSAMGFTDFDYGTGSDGYKRYFCDTVQMVGEARIVRPSLRRLPKQGATWAIGLVGGRKGQRLEDRIRRRWNVIEACEVTLAGRVRGLTAAAQAALNKRD